MPWCIVVNHVILMLIKQQNTPHLTIAKAQWNTRHVVYVAALAYQMPIGVLQAVVMKKRQLEHVIATLDAKRVQLIVAPLIIMDRPAAPCQVVRLAQVVAHLPLVPPA